MCFEMDSKNKMADFEGFKSKQIKGKQKKFRGTQNPVSGPM